MTKEIKEKNLKQGGTSKPSLSTASTASFGQGKSLERHVVESFAEEELSAV